MWILAFKFNGELVLIQIIMTENHITPNALLKNKAKDFLAGKYQNVIMTFLFYIMMLLLFTRFSNSLTSQVCISAAQFFSLSQDSYVLLVTSYLIPFIVNVLANMLKLGLCLYFLNIACHQNYNAFDLLYGYTHLFGKTLCLSGIMSLLSFIALLPADRLLSLYQSDAFDLNDSAILLAVQAALLIAYLYFYLSFSQVYYIALDHPELSVKQILQQSMKLMEGKRGRLLLLDLSFLPLFALALPTLGLSMFWIMPYLSMTHSLFFLELMQAEVTPDSHIPPSYY